MATRGTARIELTLKRAYAEVVLDVEAKRPNVLERPLFTVGASTFAWGDVIRAAEQYGGWSELEEHARAGLAGVKRLEAEGGELDKLQIADASTRFRYERNLLAGDQLTEWLARWDVSATEWRDYIRRTLLRERWAGELRATAERFPVADEEVARALWAEAVCSGFVERFAGRFASDAALAAAAGERFDQRDELVRRMRAAADRVRAEAVSDDAIEREVSAHALEWLRIDAELLELADEEAAREAALCIRFDGRTVADVAADGGVQPARWTAYVGEVDASLSPLLAAAREGELVGPVERDGGYSLFLVEAKTPPTATDPEVRRRAAERLAQRAVHRALSDHVEWHEHL